MLKKLYKHEFYSLFRSTLAIYVALIGLAVLCKLSWLVNEESVIGSILQMTTTATYILGLVAMLVIGFVIVIVRFFKNLISKEGYLTFTLPFKATQHLNCKLICGATVIIVNFLVAFLSLLIFFIGTDSAKEFIDNLVIGFKGFVSYYGKMQGAVVVILVLLIILISVLGTLIMTYAAMSIGQRFRSKIGGSIVAYLCIYSAIESIEMVFVVISMLFGDKLTSLFENYEFKSVFALLCFGILYLTVIYSVLYIVSRIQLTKHLNLE